MQGSSSQDNNKQKISLKTQNKYVLIVVGRSGHGKSSFVKMIVSDEEKGKVKPATGAITETSECIIYRSDKFYDIFKQDIYVIDTPGIDLKTMDQGVSSSLVGQDIDDLIITHKAQIIGIIYVVDIHQKEKNQEGQGYIFTFLERLKIKYCHKKNLTFTVSTKFDLHYDQKQTNQKLIQEFQIYFKQKSYGQMWNRRIEWMSQPDKDKQLFKKKIAKEDQAKPFYDKQWPLLNQILKTIYQTHGHLSFQTYQKDRTQYGQIIKNRIIQNYHCIKTRPQTSSFTIQVILSDQGVKTPSVAITAGFLGLVRGGGILTEVSAATAVAATEAGTAVAGAATVLNAPVIIGAGVIILSTCAIGYGIYKLFNRFKGEVSPQTKEQDREHLLFEKLSIKLSAFLAVTIAAKIQRNQDQFILDLKKLPYLKMVQIFDATNSLVKNVKLNNLQKLRQKLGINKNKITFTYYLPTRESYFRYFEDHSFYNKKQ